MLGWIVNLFMVGSQLVKALAQSRYETQCEGAAKTNQPGLCNNWTTADMSEPKCISCAPQQGTTPALEADCILTVGDTSGSSTQNAKVVCFAAGVEPTFRVGELCPHSFLVMPHSDIPPPPGFNLNLDIELDAKVFFAGPDDLSVGGLDHVCFVDPGPDPLHGINPPGFVSIVHYHLQDVLTVDVDPCHPFSCSTGPFQGEINAWLCRAFVNNEQGSGWRIWCNPIIHGALDAGIPPISVLVAPRPLDLFPDKRNRQPMLVEFQSSVGSCFQYANQFCFTDNCNTGDKIDCIKNTGFRATEQVTALAALDVAFSGQINTDPQAFPHTNFDDVNIQNAVLKTVSAYRFQVRHSGGEIFDSASLNAWNVFEFFLANTINDPNAITKHVALPQITTDGVSESNGGSKIKITCVEPFTNTIFEATLRMFSVSITANLNVERRLFPGDFPGAPEGLWRMMGSVNVVAQVVVFLEPSAYQVNWPFRFLGRPNGPSPAQSDLRVEDPRTPGVEHPLIKVIPKGPFGGRIPQRPDFIVWRGLNAITPYGTEPTWRVHNTAFISGINQSCCGVLKTIHTSPVFGEVSDFRATPLSSRPQLYTGSMSFILPDAGNQPLENVGFCGIPAP